ncbi:HD domain-containing protein [Xenorhabdus bovienii]|uniref:HD domain-containing protein n=1 Tax=Xenorhabdus bovienii TaxID=40576 RepID=UPI0023B33737|nr:HD domain-containing protein [Xenorhabdus bovienii]
MLINNFGYIIRYWGKAQKNIYSDADYHLLAYHCLDVAAVGKYLLAPHKKLPPILRIFWNYQKKNYKTYLYFFCSCMISVNLLPHSSNYIPQNSTLNY